MNFPLTSNTFIYFQYFQFKPIEFRLGASFKNYVSREEESLFKSNVIYELSQKQQIFI